MSNAFPMYLVDDYPDGAINEHAWVEITERTANPHRAVEWLASEIEPEDDMRYIVTGTSHQRPCGYPVPGSDARSVKPLEEYGLCTYPGCIEGKIEAIDEIRQPPAPQPMLARYIGLELTPEVKAKIEELGGRVVATTRDNCDECYGTGRNGEFIFESCEPIPWEVCEADHPEALHFWNIELTDDPDAPIDPSGARDVSDQQEKMDI